MASGELGALGAGELRADGVADVARPSLNVSFARSARELNVELDAELLAELAAELFVIAGLVAQPIVDVQRADVSLAAEFNCYVEQADRITPTGKADDNPLTGLEETTAADPLKQIFAR